MLDRSLSRCAGVVVKVAVLGAGLALSTPARADFAEADYGDYEPPEPVRRSGFTFGLDYGLGYANISGYPNKLTQIGDSAYEQTVSAPASSGALWLGGALRDWLTFSVGYGIRGGGTADMAGGAGAILFRLEGYPLFFKGGRFRDLAVMGEFGAGSGAIVRSSDNKVVAEAGSMSSVAFGAFYEPWQFWNFSAGPVLRYGHDFSESWSSHSVTLGLRMAFYSTQPD
jgi:hypothetical protein